MVYSITKEESNSINIWKFFMMLLIVFQHGDQYCVYLGGESVVTVPFELQTFVYTLFIGAVNTFFFISGMLLFRKEFTWFGNLKSKFWRLVVPYIFFNTFWIIVFYVFQLIPATQTFFSNSNNLIRNWNLTNWIKAYGYYSRPFVYPLWYLRDLFVLNIIAVVLKKAIDRFPVAFLILLLIPFITAYYSQYIPFEANSLCFFCAGYYYLKYRDRLAVLRKVPLAVIAVIYCLLFILVFKTHFTDNYHWQYDQLCIVFQMWFCYRLSFIFSRNIKFTSFANSFAKYLYPFFLMHEYLLYGLKKVFAYLLPNTILFRYLDFALTPFITLLICYIVCRVLEKILPAFYRLITGQPIRKSVQT